MNDGDAPAPLLRALVAAVDAGEPVVLATVVDTCRSTPRHAGSKMLVYADGRSRGSVGGGAVEARVVREALAALADGRARLLRHDLLEGDGDEREMCGGEMSVYLEPQLPPPTVMVVGCGHVGSAVVELAHWLGFRVVATDDRPELVTRERLPDADVLVPGAVDEALRRVRVTADTHLVVTSRSVRIDVEALPLLLGTPAGSIGVLGSRRRWEATRAALLARGVPEESLRRVEAPIGLALGAETPREIALAILGQIVAGRRGERVGALP